MIQFDRVRFIAMGFAAAACAFVLLPGFTPPTASAGETCEASACGDLDASGTTAASDALLLLKCAVGQSVALECTGGLSCWDQDGDGVCDAEEDINEDESCDVLDCRGPAGEPGPKGDTGDPGPQGEPGPQTLSGLLNTVEVTGVIDGEEVSCLAAACAVGQVVTGCGYTNNDPANLLITSLKAETVADEALGCRLCGFLDFGGPVFIERGILQNASVQAICAD